MRIASISRFICAYPSTILTASSFSFRASKHRAQGMCFTLHERNPVVFSHGSIISGVKFNSIRSGFRICRHRHQRQHHAKREQDCQQLCLERFILHSLNFLSYSFSPHSEQNALPCVISAPQFGHFVLSFVPQ